MDGQPGSITGALAIAAIDRAEALDKATVELQAAVREEFTQLQAGMRQDAAELHTLLRKEAGALLLLRDEIKRNVKELKDLQPGIERTAGLGLRTAVSDSMEEIRRDLAKQVSASAQEIQNAAVQVRAMRQRLTAQWSFAIGAGGFLLGNLLSYGVLRSELRDIQAQLTQMQQAAPASVQAAPSSSPPVLPTPGGSGHPKSHGGRTAASKARPGPEAAVPPSPEPEQP